jgi:RloB-like protein
MAKPNKSAQQTAARDQHKQQKQARRPASSFDRLHETRAAKDKILIVCEGKNTEPSYFRQFRYSAAAIEKVEIKGEGYNTLSLVNRAEELKNTAAYADFEVWCVFDADPKPDNPSQLANFNKAIAKAEALEYGIAYSHQAFEYWLILHFEDHQGGGMDRKLYHKKLNGYLKSINPRAGYDEDSKKITDDIFNILLGFDTKTGKSRQALAIERAKKIYDKYDHSNPAAEESSTTVFRLVNKLNGVE